MGMHTTSRQRPALTPEPGILIARSTATCGFVAWRGPTGVWRIPQHNARQHFPRLRKRCRQFGRLQCHIGTPACAARSHLSPIKLASGYLGGGDPCFLALIARTTTPSHVHPTWHVTQFHGCVADHVPRGSAATHVRLVARAFSLAGPSRAGNLLDTAAVACIPTHRCADVTTCVDVIANGRWSGLCCDRLQRPRAQLLRRVEHPMGRHVSQLARQIVRGSCSTPGQRS